MNERPSLSQFSDTLAAMAAEFERLQHKYAEGLRALEVLAHLSKGSLEEQSTLRSRLVDLCSSLNDSALATADIQNTIAKVEAAERHGVQHIEFNREAEHRIRSLRNRVMHSPPDYLSASADEMSPVIAEINRQVRRLTPIPEESSFASRVRNAVRGQRNTEFTVSDIEAILPVDEAGRPSGARQQIAMVLNDLARKGVIVVTAHGSGNRPNRYRRVMTDEDIENLPHRELGNYFHLLGTEK